MSCEPRNSRRLHYILLHPTNDIYEIKWVSVSDAALASKNGITIAELSTMVTEDICRRWKIEFDPDGLTFYRVEEVIRVREVNVDFREKLTAMCTASRSCQKAAKVRYVVKVEDDDSLLDFLVTVGVILERGRLSDHQASTNVEPMDPKARLWHRLDEVIGAATAEGAPSTNASASLYRTYQMGPGRILDGRFGDGGTVNIGPPIELYHTVFAKFRADLKDVSKKPTTQIIQATANLMRSTSEIIESERLRAVRTRRLLSDLMGRELVQVINFNRTSPNCVSLSLEIPPKGTVAPLLIEEKGTGNDPCAQAGLSILQYWADPSRATIREACRCPTILVAVAGPYLCVMGAVLLDKAVVQHLTDWVFIGQDRHSGKSQAMNLARMFQCLVNAVDSLCEWYRTTPLIECDFSRFFPEITSYSSKGQEFQFVYKERLHQHDWRLTFLARITVNGTEGDSIVVKFVDRYGVEPHELLASEELAPRLMDFSDLAKRRPGHWYDGFGMVVMEHLEGTTLADKYAGSVVSDDVRAAVIKAIGILAGKDLVHGDLRRPNVMVLNGDGKEQVRIIDFDWSGRAEVVRYPLFLSSSVFPAELGIRDYELIEKSHDVVVAERMFFR